MKSYNDVVEIVRQVLEVDQVDTSNDFFDLGATSLTIMRIVENVQAAIGSKITVTDAFDAPDVESFALLAARTASG